ncbi:3672_t:CDS:2, partial [Scutellospora calospora]
ANQSINIAINYSNTNKTIMISLKETAITYASAITTSCELAVGLTQVVPCLKFTSPSTYGNRINIYDTDRNNLGKSQKADTNAVRQVAISHILTNFSVLTISLLIPSQLGM